MNIKSITAARKRLIGRLKKIVTAASKRLIHLLKKKASAIWRDALGILRDFKKLVAILAMLFFFALWISPLHNDGPLYSITQSNQSFYDSASQQNECKHVRFTNVQNDRACEFRKTIWVRLDPNFYKYGALYRRSVGHRRLARLLTLLARRNPKVVIVDVGLTMPRGGGRRDAVRSFFDRVARTPCRKGVCTRWILASTVRTRGKPAHSCVWGASPLSAATLSRSANKIFMASSVGEVGESSGYERFVGIATTCKNARNSGSSVRLNAAVLAAEIMGTNRRAPNPTDPTIIRNERARWGDKQRIFYRWREKYVCHQSDACLSATGILEMGASSAPYASLKNAAVFVGPGRRSAGAISDIHITPLGLMPGTLVLINAYRTLLRGGVYVVPLQKILIVIIGLAIAVSAEMKHSENIVLLLGWLFSISIALSIGFLFEHQTYIEFGFLFATVSISSALTVFIGAMEPLFREHVPRLMGRNKSANATSD